MSLLAQIAEVVTIELGWPALEREELAIAWYVAMELADCTGGLLQDFEQTWWDPADHSEPLG